MPTLFCTFRASKASEGVTICAALLHVVALALGWCCRESRAICPPLTFFSGGSLQPDSFTLWRSWNLIRTSSMLSWSRSQKLARSWEEGWGYAEGSCSQRDQRGHEVTAQGRSTKPCNAFQVFFTMNLHVATHSPNFVDRGGKTAGLSETWASGHCRPRFESAQELGRKQHVKTYRCIAFASPSLWLNLLSSGRSFSSASLSMFWHHPSILSTSVCRRRKKNSPSLMHGEARPESGRLRGPSRDGVPAQALSEVSGRGEWERGGKWGCWRRRSVWQDSVV